VKFLVDAHLPRSLCGALTALGHDAIHTMDLPDGNDTRDRVINQVSMSDQRVVITKDTDFYYSHLLQARPWKLVLLRTGNIGVADLKKLLLEHLGAIESALRNFTLVELDRHVVNVVA
jgi:predicted nuclease of predicted toxin-antitoxin system